MWPVAEHYTRMGKEVVKLEVQMSPVDFLLLK